MRFNLGDVIDFKGMTGYVVGIEIDPLQACNIFEELDLPIYTIRIYGDYYKYGYFDFKTTEDGIKERREKKSVHEYGN